MPSQLDNLKFFFSYQVNFMYWRYFLWNFAGRQNDIQGNGEIEHGNWLTGIKPFDKYVLGIDMVGGLGTPQQLHVGGKNLLGQL